MIDRKQAWVWVVLGGLALLTSRDTRKPRVPGMIVKNGVTLFESQAGTVSDHLVKIRSAILDVWSEHGLTPTITSSYRSSGAHSRGEAEDYRTRDINAGLLYVLAADVSRHELLDESYQVIIEDGSRRWYYRDGVFEGYRDDKPLADAHIHVEFDGGP